MIKLVRIDHQLLHAQVAYTWIKHLDINCILIANDEVLKSEQLLRSTQVARPKGVKLVIKSVDDAIKALQSGVTDHYRLLLLVESVEDAKRISEAVHLDTLYLARTKPSSKKLQLTSTVYVTENEKQTIKEIIAAGTHVLVQDVPTDDQVDLSLIVK